MVMPTQRVPGSLFPLLVAIQSYSMARLQWLQRKWTRLTLKGRPTAACAQDVADRGEQPSRSPN